MSALVTRTPIDGPSRNLSSGDLQIPLYPTAAAADPFVLLVVGLLQHTMGEAERGERGREGEV